MLPMKSLLIIQFRNNELESAEQQSFTKIPHPPSQRIVFFNGLLQIDYPPLDSLSGIILAGSGDHSMTKSHPWYDALVTYITGAIHESIPVLGICFGHQFLGRMLGAQVVSDAAQREIGTVPIRLTLAGEQDPLCEGLPNPFRSITGYNDSVTNLPQDLVLLASDQTCASQAFRYKTERVWGVQFHPELTVDDYRHRLAYYYDAYGHGAAYESLAARGTGSLHAERVLKNFYTMTAAV